MKHFSPLKSRVFRIFATDDPENPRNIVDQKIVANGKFFTQEHPEIVREAVYYLNSWHDKMMKTMDSDRDPLWTVMQEGGPFHARGHLKAYCEFLEKTGRAYAIEELKKRHPGEF